MSTERQRKIISIHDNTALSNVFSMILHCHTWCILASVPVIGLTSISLTKLKEMKESLSDFSVIILSSHFILVSKGGYE